MHNMPVPCAISPRERFYSDDELKAIWKAAEKIGGTEEVYVKLILLLALRREELAQAMWSEFDNANAPTQFVVPFERTKGKVTRKRKTTYVVPLPALAQRILRKLVRDGENLFPRIDQQRLKAKLVEEGAPKDFKLHVARHTIATWMENEGKSEYERGLVLNHAASGVTAGYSHGTASKLKLELLSQWSGHVERLVQPGENVTPLFG
jgi:integrase